MTKEQIIEKLQKKELTEKEFYDYYGVKNYDGFLSLLMEKFDNVKYNNEYIFNGFDYIYSKRNITLYNPIEEEFMLYGIILKALFDFDTDEYNIITDFFGIFKALQIFNEILMDNKNVKYFIYLYNKYIEKRENVKTAVEENLREIYKLVSGYLDDLDPSKIKELTNQFTEELSKLK